MASASPACRPATTGPGRRSARTTSGCWTGSSACRPPNGRDSHRTASLTDTRVRFVLRWAAMDLPKIISVDDHVVEPPHVWQTWLPEKHRDRGPKVVRKRWGNFRQKGGAKYEMNEDPEGLWGDAWVYDGELIYVHKRFGAIPES